MKKKKRQPNQLTIAYIAAGVILAGTMMLLGISAFMRVNSIVVEGISVYTPDQVAEASGVEKGDNLLYLSKANIEKRISEELTYINCVEVERNLPDTLMIRVTESTALAYIPFAGNALIIDSTGRILETVRITIGTPVEVRGKRLIEIRGVPVNEAVPGKMPVVGQGSEMSFKAMHDILAIFELEGVAADVNYLDVANITDISFGYNDMYRILVGGTRDFRNKIASLASGITIIQERFPNARGVYNMKDPSGEYRFTPD